MHRAIVEDLELVNIRGLDYEECLWDPCHSCVGLRASEMELPFA